MKHLINKNLHKNIGVLLSEWCNHNRKIQTIYIAQITVIISLMVLCFDFIFAMVSGLTTFIPVRLLTTSFLLTVWAGLQRIKFDVSSKKHQLIFSLAMLSMCLFWNYLYVYFYLTVEQKFRVIVVSSLYMSILFTSYATHKFWKTQYLQTGLLFVSFCFLGYFKPEAKTECVSLIFFLMSGFWVFWWFRRSFASSLNDQNEFLNTTLPPKIARYLTVADTSADMSEVFRPTLRHCVCISADWRGFQKFAASSSPDIISGMLSKFHEGVKKTLQETIPEATYFFEWVADMAFVTIYSDEDVEKDVKIMAFRFLTKMITEFPVAIKKEAPLSPNFDIGAAYGVGLVGLIGPNKNKKTTIIGEVAGLSTRLESVAKEKRLQLNINSSYPILVIDDNLMAFISEQDGLFSNKFIEINSNLKDTQNTKKFAFHHENLLLKIKVAA